MLLSKLIYRAPSTTAIFNRNRDFQRQPRPNFPCMGSGVDHQQQPQPRSGCTSRLRLKSLSWMGPTFWHDRARILKLTEVAPAQIKDKNVRKGITYQGTNGSGHKRVWAQSCVGTIVCGHKRVRAQMCVGTIVCGHKRVWAQSCVGTIVCGHNRVWAQSCVGTIVSGHKRVWAQSCVGTNVCGHNRVWAQTCLGTIVCGHNRVGSIMYGPNRGGTVTGRTKIRPGFLVIGDYFSQIDLILRVNLIQIFSNCTESRIEF